MEKNTKKSTSRPKNSKNEKNPFLNKPLEFIEIQRETLNNVPTSNGFQSRRETNISLFDSDTGAKLYKTQSFEKVVYNLDEKALKLLMYICLHLGKDKEKIHLTRKKILPLIGMGESSYYAALKSLVQIGIVANAKGRANMYWVNPHYIFNGSRYSTFRSSSTSAKDDVNIKIVATKHITPNSKNDDQPPILENSSDTPSYGFEADD
ncbi:hypothetical protein [Leeuwenhoekiella parthenopeia]|uniref:Plasmid replication protein RepL domain-containing protein n=1 Tax=Leeuwenhoekiella parthenopeia TaxID=2890320 RepID=A0ABS8GMX1_9FLAO|nr:hypothetical protein [Leeuwenhoekiella parthenopeia]MCC4211332.1 hypothetical protein [Leeuwenhoekiella parthenopeia]